MWHDETEVAGVRSRLEEALGPGVSIEHFAAGPDAESGFLVSLGPIVFAADVVRGRSDLPVVAKAVKRAQTGHVGHPERLPLLVVSHMSSGSMALCEREHISWLDLEGNARIDAPGIRVRVNGRPRRPGGARGRPPSMFAPRSANVARWLLLHGDSPQRQRDIARGTGLDEGTVSRVAGRLVDAGLAYRHPDGALMVPDRVLLLEAWREEYRFNRHDLLRCHAFARSGEELLHRSARTLSDLGVRFAATGLAGAWLWKPFAAFRLVSFFVDDIAASRLLDALGAREVSSGENLWLVRPDNPGVYLGSTVRDDVPCVHPLQVWLDLKSHPERAPEAAEALRPLVIGDVDA